MVNVVDDSTQTVQKYKFIPGTLILIMRSNVQKLSGSDFEEILKGSESCKYQIIDVRERGDFANSITEDVDGVINLPLSKSYKWSNEVVEGNFLDAGKPTLCVCKSGQRSALMASFLGTVIDYVYIRPCKCVFNNLLFSFYSI